MEVSSRRPTKRPIEPVDEWLHKEGYYRKNAPKDPTCLFRAISEQVYQNQRYHIRVRDECIDFMRKNRNLFEEKISIPFDSYLDQMVCFTEWGGMNEISAMSLLYKRNVVMFHAHKLKKETIIDHGFNDSFFLCFTLLKQYESVYTQEYTANAGFCQSIVYLALYKNVFKMNNVDVTVHKMLHGKSNHLRHDRFFLKGNLDIRNQLTLQLLDKLEDSEDNEELQLLSKGITPFPYRVAKALDPNIYRNVDYDIWIEIRREVRCSGYKKFNSTELQAGAKCLVQVNLKETDKTNNNCLSTPEQWDNNSKAIARPKRMEPLFYTGHIQDMGKHEGHVLVFVEELGQMVTVAYDSLKPFPQRKINKNIYTMTSNKRNSLTQNNKWKKTWNSGGRRIKDQVPNESVDKNKINNSKVNNKNAINKSEWGPDTSLDNHSVKQQTENYGLHNDFNVNVEVDNLRNELENTHVSMVDAVDQLVADNKSKNSTVNDVYDDPSKKSPATNVNQDPNQSNKQHNRIDKNEIFYPPYPNHSYSPNQRYSGDSEMVNYELMKTMEVDGNEIPYSDPATVRRFFNLGVKYFWSQNIWANGNNSQTFGDNSYFMSQSPPDTTPNSNIMTGSIPTGESGNLVNNSLNNNNSGRHNNRTSPPRHRDQENLNGTRSGGQKSNYRGSEFRNPSTNRDYQQSTYTDVNKNRVDCKNSNLNEHQQQQTSNNKEPQRSNKLSGVAPRFKRNYEGRNRNDHHNGQYQYRQQQQQQDYEFRNNKKQGELPIMTNQFDANGTVPMQQQNQNSMPHQQQSSPLQSQSPPSLNNSYSYPIVPYNQQVPFIPISPYPTESEAFPGHYYSPPPSFVQVPYIPQSEVSESGNMSNVPQVYQAVENYPTPYPPVYSQYVYHPPTMYPNQAPGAPIPENGYPPYNGQPYYFPYPPPPIPPNMPITSAPNPQSGPSH